LTDEGQHFTHIFLLQSKAIEHFGAGDLEKGLHLLETGFKASSIPPHLQKILEARVGHLRAAWERNDPDEARRTTMGCLACCDAKDHAQHHIGYDDWNNVVEEFINAQTAPRIRPLDTRR